MCLGIPGRVEEILDTDPILRTGKVRFGEITKDVNLSCVPEVSIGDYVVVHVGFAISKVEEDEAKKVFDWLSEMGDVDEIRG